MKKNEVQNESHSIKIKRGIAKARSRSGYWGRPPITKTKNDPGLALKAIEMRSKGLSWSEIADNLGVGRTTARRLVGLCQKDGYEQGVVDGEKTANVKANGGSDSESKSEQETVSENVNDQNHYSTSSSDNPALNNMPKTFQIFSNLLEKAWEKKAK